MITKIEIDGFKTFRDFAMEFAPLTIVAGANASGKSNLFDAMRLLSLIVETDLKTAFNEGNQRGNANELFTQFTQTDISREMKFAVELLVDKNIKDKFGGEANLKYTRLRYSIKIKRIINDRGLDDLVVIHEQLDPIRHDDDKWIKKFVPKFTVEKWRPKVGAGRRGVAYIDTSNDRISLRQDGKGGVKKEFSSSNIFQAIISIVNSVDFPHALAAKEEISNWKFLQLNPEDLRRPSSYMAKSNVTHTGENLAAAIHRIKISDPQALRAIERKLNLLLPNIVHVDVLDDKAGRQFVIQVKTQDGREFTSRVLSEGTLRLLTLCVFMNDPEHKGIICFEEPENGIHPARVRTTVILLKDLVTHFSEDDFELRQVIVNTHSPVLLKEIFALDDPSLYLVWLSEFVTRSELIGDKKYSFQATKMLPVLKDPKQLSISFSENEMRYSLSNVVSYLQNMDTETIKEIVKA